MSHVKHEGNRKIAPTDQLDSSLNDEGSCSGSSLGETVLKKGPWTSLEDAVLVDYVSKHGERNWNAVQKHSGLSRCGKSCRLRWINHLRPNLKKGSFTKEEEKMVVQLHYKLGNKWSQIAAMLPGRTDNEIKNYWNTRMKRRQRACLPLYPQDMFLQASNVNQLTLSNSTHNNGYKRDGNVLQGDMYGLLDVVSDHFKRNPGPLPYSPPFPDISLTGLQSQGLGLHVYSFNTGVNPAKHLRESESYIPGNHGSMTNGLRMFEQLPPVSVNKNLLSLGYSKPDSLIQPNGNFSTSMPLTGTLKMELPSLQYPETDCFSWLACPSAPPYEAIHTYMQSPPLAASTRSDCTSSSSGLLETLVQGSHAISTVRKQSSEKSSNYSAFSSSDMLENSTSNMCTADWEGTGVPNSPFYRSAISPFSECAPISSSSLDELPDSKGSLEMTKPSAEQISTPNVVEKDISHWLNLPRPNALLGSGWYTEASQEHQ